MARTSLVARIRRRVLGTAAEGRYGARRTHHGQAMSRHAFMRTLHTRLAPRTYLEIGVDDGRSLALSRATSIAVDPVSRITHPLQCDLLFVESTSDDFFAGPDPLAHFRRVRDEIAVASSGDASPVIDLAFIDGMHLFEFALRDFMNSEHHARWWSVIACDDMLPRTSHEATRDHHPGAWAGDVYKLQPVLREHRPDLVLIPVDTTPTGLLLIVGADPRNGLLRDAYGDIVERWVTPDPQAVPSTILGREGAYAPAPLLASPLWSELAEARTTGMLREEGLALVRRRLEAVTHR